MRLGDERLLEDAARDPGLVGDDDHGESAAVQQPDRVHAVGEEHEPFEAIEVPGLFDQRAVAVEKYGRPVQHCVFEPSPACASSRAATAPKTASGVMPFMQR